MHGAGLLKPKFAGLLCKYAMTDSPSRIRRGSICESIAIAVRLRVYSILPICLYYRVPPNRSKENRLQGNKLKRHQKVSIMLLNLRSPTQIATCILVISAASLLSGEQMWLKFQCGLGASVNVQLNRDIPVRHISPSYIYRQLNQPGTIKCAWEFKLDEALLTGTILVYRHNSTDLGSNFTVTLTKGTDGSTEAADLSTQIALVNMTQPDKLTVKLTMTNDTAHRLTGHLEIALISSVSCVGKDRFYHQNVCYLVTEQRAKDFCASHLHNCSLLKQYGNQFNNYSELSVLAAKIPAINGSPLLLLRLRACNGILYHRDWYQLNGSCKWSPITGDSSNIRMHLGNSSSPQFVAVQTSSDHVQLRAFSPDEASEMRILLALPPSGLSGDNCSETSMHEICENRSEPQDPHGSKPLVIIVIVIGIALVVLIPTGLLIWRRFRGSNSSGAGPKITRTEWKPSR